MRMKLNRKLHATTRNKSVSLSFALSRSHTCMYDCLSVWADRRAARPIDIITRKVTQVVATVFDSNWGVNYTTHKMKLKRVGSATAPTPAPAPAPNLCLRLWLLTAHTHTHPCDTTKWPSDTLYGADKRFPLLWPPANGTGLEKSWRPPPQPSYQSGWLDFWVGQVNGK